MNDITVGSIVFYTWDTEYDGRVTNLVTKVLKDHGDGTVAIATRRMPMRVSKQRLTNLPVNTDFPICVLTQHLDS